MKRPHNILLGALVLAAVQFSWSGCAGPGGGGGGDVVVYGGGGPWIGGGDWVDGGGRGWYGGKDHGEDHAAYVHPSGGGHPDTHASGGGGHAESHPSGGGDHKDDRH
jgi:hypothetical protein